MTLNVEILGPWLHNRGDELGLWAVARQLEGHAKLGASSNLGLDAFPTQPPLYKIKWPSGLGDLLSRLGRADLREVVRLSRDNAMLAAMPQQALHGRGWMAGSKIDLMVDCSGYGYGDMWSLERTRVRSEYAGRLKRHDAKIAVLPQAFGPFEKPEIRHACRRFFAHCDLIFARDGESRAHLLSLGVDESLVEIAPDVTHLVEGATPADAQAWERRIAVVPNARMLDRGAQSARNAYREFLESSIRFIRSRDLEPVLIVHEDNDLPLARELASSPGCDCTMFHESALVLKGMLGAARGVIASRYHACISALSQGVPTLATSWSHKYEALFADYGCAELVISPDAPQELQHASLARLTSLDARAELSAWLRVRAATQKELAAAMWQKIIALAGGTQASGFREPAAPSRRAGTIAAES